ncbi:MAG: hypothetical protein ACREXX_09995, partial [Gammaproteobacteria bacterium]
FLTPHLESSPAPALDTIIDISHESLIRQWETLKNWVIDEAKSADTYLRLKESARLYRVKNADPYRGLDLQGALEWRKTERPTDAWARRYGAKGKETEAFEGAIAFLDESAKNRDKEQASQERRRRNERIGAVVMFALVTTAGVYSYVQWQNAEQQRQSAEQERQRADDETSRAEEHKTHLLNVMWRLTDVIRLEELSPSTGLMDMLDENAQWLDKIAKEKGATAEGLRTTSVTWTALGDIRLRSHAVKAAEKAYRRGLEIDQRLVEKDTSDRQSKRDLSVSYIKVGKALFERKRFPDGLKYYNKSLDIRKPLAKEGRKGDEWRGGQIDLARNYEKIAEVNIELNDFHAALAAAEQVRVIRQELLDECKERKKGCKEDEERLQKSDAKILTIERQLVALGGPSR